MKRLYSYPDGSTVMREVYLCIEVDAALEEYKRWRQEERAALSLAETEVERLKALAKRYAKLAYDYMRHVEDTHPQWLEAKNAEIDGGGK